MSNVALMRSDHRASARPCGGCARMTEHDDRLCASCRVTYREAKSYKPQPEDAATGGRWVPRGGVLVWQRKDAKPAWLSGIDGQEWENETARIGASTPTGPNRQSLSENERG